MPNLLVSRAITVQTEAARLWSRDHWLPYIWESIDGLPDYVRELQASGDTKEATRAVLNLERFTGILSREAYTSYINQLDGSSLLP